MYKSSRKEEKNVYLIRFKDMYGERALRLKCTNEQQQKKERKLWHLHFNVLEFGWNSKLNTICGVCAASKKNEKKKESNTYNYQNLPLHPRSGVVFENCPRLTQLF